MTARVCPVHGEYAADGICRWCEKQPLPGLKGIWQTPDSVEVNEAGVPTYTYTFTFAAEDAIAVHWTLDFTPAICPEDLMAAHEAELLAQHAALRWERVARRWATKHGPWTMRDVAFHWQFFFDKLVAIQVKRLEEMLHPLLHVPTEEPKR